MNDYTFGNRLYELRKQFHLSQTDLANQLGVSNKAVSKWENGKAKPTTDTLRKLAAIFNINVNDLLDLKEYKEKQITTIVITGGPCAGKSTAMSWIQNAFSELGYAVLFINEAATELINGGISPSTCTSSFEFQKVLTSLQIEKEKIYKEGAQVMKEDKILIVCDRGLIDNKAYMSELEFASLLQSLNTNEVTLRDSYDAVFHLVSAAIGAKEFYTTANNTARKETVEEAALLDNKLLHAWTGHPHLRVIDNDSGFEEKMRKLIKEISAFLGEPEPYEIERKFLIQYPKLKYLENNPACKKVEIIQTYLQSDNDEEIRIRARGDGINHIYTKTIKRKISNTKRIELEERLTLQEYMKLLMQADTTKKQIRKTRYCLTYENQYLEIDLYPFWNDQAILEIELNDENQDISIPNYLHVIKEVTDDEQYKNASLASL